MKKRILCLLSAVLLLLSLMPIAAWAASTVTAVDIMVSHPVHLGQPDGFIQVYGTGCKLDTSVNTDGHQNGVRWRKISSGKVMDETDTYVGNELYELSVFLVADSGYSFSVSQTAVSVNMEEAFFTFIDDTHIQAKIQLTADNLYINAVTVTGLDAPWVGKSLDYSVTVQENTCSLTSSGYDTCKDGVTWYDGTEGKYLPVGTKAVAGHEYWAEIHLRANAGYIFPDDMQCNVDGKWIESSGGGEVIALVVMFEACTDHKWSPKYHAVDASGHAYICANCKACSEIMPHIPGPAGTPGAAEVCKDCGYIITPAENHTHKLTLVPEVAPTCTEPGARAHYTCSGCSELFKDENAKETFTSDDLVIPPQGHKISNGWEFDEKTHWRVCVQCDEKMIETDMEHELKNDKCTTCQYDKNKSEEIDPEETEPKETKPNSSKKDSDSDDEPEGLQWWAIVLIAVGAVALGVGTGVVLMIAKKKR